jgi:heme-degrading monooxygenase HmoA
VRNVVLKPVQGEPYVVMTWWADEASFQAWTESEAFHQAHADRPPREMFSGPNQLEIHEVLTLSEAAGKDNGAGFPTPHP